MGGIAMKELIETIAKALVDHPEQVSVNVLEGSQATVLELNVAKVDLGKVIGKQGRTAKAIRTILGATSAKLKKRTVLEIVECRSPCRPPPLPEDFIHPTYPVETGDGEKAAGRTSGARPFFQIARSLCLQPAHVKNPALLTRADSAPYSSNGLKCQVLNKMQPSKGYVLCRDH